MSAGSRVQVSEFEWVYWIRLSQIALSPPLPHFSPFFSPTALENIRLQMQTINENTKKMKFVFRKQNFPDSNVNSFLVFPLASALFSFLDLTSLFLILKSLLNRCVEGGRQEEYLPLSNQPRLKLTVNTLEISSEVSCICGICFIFPYSCTLVCHTHVTQNDAK